MDHIPTRIYSTFFAVSMFYLATACAVQRIDILDDIDNFAVTETPANQFAPTLIDDSEILVDEGTVDDSETQDLAVFGSTSAALDGILDDPVSAEPEKSSEFIAFSSTNSMLDGWLEEYDSPLASAQTATAADSEPAAYETLAFIAEKSLEPIDSTMVYASVWEKKDLTSVRHDPGEKRKQRGETQVMRMTVRVALSSGVPGHRPRISLPSTKRTYDLGIIPNQKAIMSRREGLSEVL